MYLPNCMSVSLPELNISLELPLLSMFSNQKLLIWCMKILTSYFLAISHEFCQ